MNTDRLPQNYIRQFSQDEIARTTERVASEVVEWLTDNEQELNNQVLVLPIMRGALFFFADLIRLIPFSVEIEPIKAQAYESNANKLSDSPVKMSLEEIDVAGRHVLLVDDICDSGATLRALTDKLMTLGAKEVRSAVLLKREIENPVFAPDYVGISHAGDEWFVGYGMDDTQHWRNLPDIYIIDKS